MNLRKYLFLAIVFMMAFVAAMPVSAETDPRTREYLSPTRIVWTQNAELISNVDYLLREGNGQADLTNSHICVMKSTKDSHPAVLLDFGSELHGGLQIVTGMPSSHAPVRIRVRFGESASEAMCEIDGKNGATNDHAVRDFEITVPWLGVREVGNSGYRFVRIDLLDDDAQLHLKEVRAVSVFRDIPYRGAFRCSDERLTSIWNTGARTVHLCMQDYLWDGIKRDRLVWMGDMHPEVMTINHVFGKTDVVPASLDLARDITPLPNWMSGMYTYSLWWVIVQRDWYKYHGDLEYLKRQREYLTGLLDILLGKVDENGFETSEGGFLDWPSKANKPAMRAGTQALMMMTMEAGAELCGYLGENELESRCRECHARMQSAAPVVSDRYYKEAKAPGEPGSKQGAALMSLAGMVDARSVNDQVLVKEGARGFSTFYGYYLLEAMAKAGNYVGAMNMISTFWGAMLDLGATSFWEDFNIDWLKEDVAPIDALVPERKKDIHGDFGAYCYEGFRHSLCHGWASGPTAWLSRHVLGVEVLEPGCKVVSINPNLGNLEWAEGSFPTPYGEIRISHRRGEDGMIVSEINAPREVKVIRPSKKRKASSIKPDGLTCEYADAPVIDIQNPRLAWVNHNVKSTKGAAQTAYRIQVAESRDGFDKPTWDSGFVCSDESAFIEYEGGELKSKSTYWWRVKVWDENGNPSVWSEPGSWHMGLLAENEWRGEWIGAPWQGNESYDFEKIQPEYALPAPLIRKSFNVEKEVREVRFYGTGLGYFEMYLNGERLGDEYFAPNQTNYDKRPKLDTRPIVVEDPFEEYLVMYLTHDLTDKIRKGENVFGVILGNGFYDMIERWPPLGYGSPRFMGQIEVVYADGSREVIASDKTWKIEKSAIVSDQIFLGEHYDARFEHEGWSAPGYDDSSWANAASKPAPCGKLVPQNGPSDRIIRKYAPEKIEKSDDGKIRVKFPVEVSGWVALKDMALSEGQKISINYLSESPGNGANTYTAKGKGKESYHARFTWFVFSEVEIEGLDELKPEQIEAHLVCSDVETSGTFRTSNALLDKINEIWQQSQLDNMHGAIASDCPHRERSPYTGDGQIACATVMHNFNAQTFYNKWIRDIRGAQLADGYVPNSAPWQPGCGGGVGWGAAMEIIPWEFYQHYGDLRVLEQNFNSMKRHVNWMLTWVNPETGIMHSKDPQKWKNLGDWLPPRKLPRAELVHTFLLWQCADIAVKVAYVLGEDASEFIGIRDMAYNAFHTYLYDEEKGSYGKYGSNVLALVMGVPAERHDRVVKALRDNIAEVNDHIDTGIVGTRYLFEVLCENGMVDLAYKIMNQKDFPSFGWWIEQGATTTWENWNGADSRNHPMFGGGLGWFYKYLAGLKCVEPGYRSFEIRPVIPEGLEWVEYTHDTTYGQIAVKWTCTDGLFNLECTVPVGSTATVYIPSADGYTRHFLVSGNYSFSSRIH